MVEFVMLWCCFKGVFGLFVFSLLFFLDIVCVEVDIFGLIFVCEGRCEKFDNMYVG